ncbi:MAG: hypothetical protein JNM74_16650, partial [Myxococcales bacterium]|nr:hypothetical protein [Myxococcales bacterium]
MRRKALPLVFVSILVAACGSAKSGTPPKGSSTSSPPTGSASTLVVDNELPEVPADPREPILADAALALLGKQHVLRKPIDDALSRDAFQKLVEELDGGKVLFLEGHVQKLSRFENDIDNELREGNLVVARKGAALVAERRAMVAKLVKTLLEKPLDFTTSNSFETDPKKRAFCKTEAELEARWRSLLKLQVLERNQQFEDILESRAKPKDESKKPKDPDEAKREAIAERALGEIPATFEGREAKIRKELATRYETQFTRLKVTEKLEPAENLLNAVNAVFDPHTTYMPP